MKFTYKVTEDSTYQTVRQVLKEEFGISRNLLIKLKHNDRIFLNQQLTLVSCLLSCGDFVEVDLGFEEVSSNVVATDIDLDIIYEDLYYLVVNKPTGMAIHPSPSHYETSLSNGVKYYFETIRTQTKNPSGE